jgi:hypothetical protein
MKPYTDRHGSLSAGADFHRVFTGNAFEAPPRIRHR